jgi:lysophospholipase L1-like esterase
LRALLAAAAATFALLVPASAAAARALDYISLGDSIAAGYGLGASLAPCGQSKEASYPARVRRRLERRHGDVRFVFLPCSGAQATDRSGARISLARQVGDALEVLGRRPALASITIGINDLRWWDVIQGAMLLRLDEAEFERWLEESTRSIREAIAAQLDRLLARPGMRVVLTEYYDPFNRQSTFFQSALICPVLEGCLVRARRVVTRLNERLRSLAGRRVAIARLQKAFEGHEGPRPDCGLAPPEAAGTWVQTDCFHPNGRGAAAYAQAVDRVARTLGL